LVCGGNKWKEAITKKTNLRVGRIGGTLETKEKYVVYLGLVDFRVYWLFLSFFFLCVGGGGGRGSCLGGGGWFFSGSKKFHP
jgi:hypothetical protein